MKNMWRPALTGHLRIVVAVTIVAAGLGTLSLASAQQPGSDPNFTGVVTAWTPRT
jgi:hypothetical protein